MKNKDIYQTIIAVLSDEASHEEKEMLTVWIKESEKNRELYEQVCKLYELSIAKNTKTSYNTDEAWAKVRKKAIARKKKFVLHPVFRYASVIILLICSGIYIYHLKFSNPDITSCENYDKPTLVLDNGKVITLENNSFSIEEQLVTIKNEAGNELSYTASDNPQKEKVVKNHLIIPKGKTYRILLADGSRIWLNSESEMIYPSHFSENQREVILIGEAYFEVAKDTNRPFIVKTQDMDITVLGTSFNVSCYEKDMHSSATLIEGSVEVKAKNGKEKIIHPSEQFSYDKTTENTSVNKVNTSIYTSWINGEYIFSNATIDEIMIKLQRWHDFQVTYDKESLKQYRFTLSVVRETPLEQIIEIINYTSQVNLEKSNNIINIKERR